MICMWCGKKEMDIKESQMVKFKGEQFPVCCNECKEKYEKTMNKKNNSRKLYLFLLIISFLIFIGICTVSGVYGLLFLLESVGLIILFYPNTTPQTVKVLGLEKSRRVAKIIAVMIMIFGIIFSVAISLTK
ncbi:hypothetical protein CCS79_17305 [Clostridium diolis]|nr:hypothetical protein CCS79_17305 [Clostridium diolis]